ncbi:MAG: DUF3499 family protein [Actinobacteria bacterium]|nr:DUF3499 family protein [Actinomycetota bacterium]
MRSCAKKPCAAPPEATIALRYEARTVVVGDLLSERDPNLMDLCRSHADTLRAMVGWRIEDRRTGPPSEVPVRLPEVEAAAG